MSAGIPSARRPEEVKSFLPMPFKGMKGVSGPQIRKRNTQTRHGETK
jgi:hypothetical protein